MTIFSTTAEYTMYRDSFCWGNKCVVTCRRDADEWIPFELYRPNDIGIPCLTPAVHYSGSKAYNFFVSSDNIVL